MGATEILKTLRKSGRLTSTEIAEQSNCSGVSVMMSIKRLLKDSSENLECRPLTPEEKEERYGHKVGPKIYLYWLNE